MAPGGHHLPALGPGCPSVSWSPQSPTMKNQSEGDTKRYI